MAGAVSECWIGKNDTRCGMRNMTVNTMGAVCFGVIIGWVTYRTLRRTGETVAVSNIASVVGAVGGRSGYRYFPGIFVRLVLHRTGGGLFRLPHPCRYPAAERYLARRW